MYIYTQCHVYRYMYSGNAVEACDGHMCIPVRSSGVATLDSSSKSNDSNCSMSSGFIALPAAGVDYSNVIVDQCGN